MISKNVLFGKTLAAFILIHPQISFAGGFTGANLLEWETKHQDAYFQTSVTMIGIVATQTGEHGHIAECIDGWLGGPVEGKERRAARIREVVQRVPEFHPQATILAIIEKACGEF